MQQELSGDNMKNALQNQYQKDNSYDDYRKYNQNMYDQQARDNYIEQLKMAKANRERLKREEFQGLEMQRALTDSQFNDESVYQKNYIKDKRKGGSEDYEALNAYMRQQRHEAVENKKRLEEAQRGSAAKAALAQYEEHQTTKRKFFNEKTGKFDYDYYSDYYSDYSDPPQSKQQQQQKQQKDDNEARNEYMRQIRHEREANRLKLQEYENMAKEQQKKKQNGSTQSSNNQKQQITNNKT